MAKWFKLKNDRFKVSLKSIEQPLPFNHTFICNKDTINNTIEINSTETRYNQYGYDVGYITTYLKGNITKDQHAYFTRYSFDYTIPSYLFRHNEAYEYSVLNLIEAIEESHRLNNLKDVLIDLPKHSLIDIRITGHIYEKIVRQLKQQNKVYANKDLSTFLFTHNNKDTQIRDPNQWQIELSKKGITNIRRSRLEHPTS